MEGFEEHQRRLDDATAEIAGMQPNIAEWEALEFGQRALHP
jgi:hypothetical protein